MQISTEGLLAAHRDGEPDDIVAPPKLKPAADRSLKNTCWRFYQAQRVWASHCRTENGSPFKGNAMFKKTFISLSAATLLIAGSATAETWAAASTDLNLRSGPGPMYSILGVIPATGMVSVQGCLAEATWCQVTSGETMGWAAGRYLNASVALTTPNSPVVVQTVTYDNEAGATAGGLATGALAGALLGGPAGAIIGGFIGAVAGQNLAPDPTVVTYVNENPVDPIYLDGEVVIGAGIPETVTLAPVPESQFSYAYINGVRVLVDNSNRSVVHIFR